MQQLYGNILADALCVCGVIHGPVVAEFYLGKSLGAKMAISDVQINGDHPQGNLAKIGQ
jgi:hypothetical protein